jgi:hypothetical protein
LRLHRGVKPVAVTIVLLTLTAVSAACGDDPPPEQRQSRFAPPRYPPPETARCASGCAGLAGAYAEAVLKAQGCNPRAPTACGLRAPGTLGCGACEVWVSDVHELLPLAEAFNDMGCYGCYFGGDVPANRCHAIACNSLLRPMCTATAGGRGSCTNDQTCPPGLASGRPCTANDGLCSGGGHQYCYCSSEGVWACS